MGRKRQGFLFYDADHNRYGIDWHETLSIVVGEILLSEILNARPYLKGRLLDIGCGKRPYSLIYEPLVQTSIGTEVAFSPHGTDAADVICCAESIPFGSDSFDTVLCTEVLEHSSQPFEVLKEIKRMLKPGGYMILSTPFVYPLHEPPNDHWRFTEYGIKKICISAGLAPITVYSKGGVGATLLSLGVNISIRFVNAVSKSFKVDPPLRERSLVRLTLSVPQWIFLWVIEHMRTPSWVKELSSWLSPGYMIIAVNPENISTFG